jgi:hypothetical protein
MPFDGEPKDGDFVRYIETLNSQTGGTPGAVPKRERAGLSLTLRKPGWGRQDARDTQTRPAGAPTPSTANPSAGATRDAGDSPPQTLAARSGQRHLSLALGIAGVVALWSALQKLLFAVNTRTLDLDTMVPVAFLLVCAGMLFKGAYGMRQKAGKPARALPPLTTIPTGRQPKV